MKKPSFKLRYRIQMLLLMTPFAVGVQADKGTTSSEITEVSFEKVQFTDHFWKQKIETNRTVSIPSAFRECEKNGRFDNFALAGGLIQGEHQGDFSFDDTDPYKIIEGASYSLASTYDPQLDHYLDSVITLIAAAQEPDGYLTTCVTNQCTRLSGWWGTHRWEKINSHELYNSGHLIEAAVAHYKATGKRTLLDVAIKNADLIDQVFGAEEGKIHRPSGHPILEMALCKLYKVTGTKKYLDLALYFVEETGRGTDGHHLNAYSQDHMPILQQEEIVGHAVRAGYLYSGVADVAALTGDPGYFQAIERIWNNMASKKLYITGGIGSRAQGEGFGPEYELHNHTAYCETCASIANVYWNHRMFLATGQAKYADVLERALYNGVISGVSLSGDKFFYDNPLESMGQHQRQKWFGCACCPGNVTRFMASIPGYVYATKGETIFVNLFVQSETGIKLENGTTVQINQSTGYPWQGEINFEVSPSRTAAFDLKLRIPGWARNQPVPSDLYRYVNPSSAPFTVIVNGKIQKAEVGSDGYVTLSRRWKKGDRVTLGLPMEVHLVQAHEKVVDDRGKWSVELGPVVYCLEGIDQWDATVFNKYLTSTTRFTPQVLEWEPYGSVIVLDAEARQVDLVKEEITVPIRAIPYYAWSNRGTENYQMTVWIPASREKARPTPVSTVASKARTFAMSVPIQHDATIEPRMEWAGGANDQWEPTSSSDTSKPYHYWWLKRGTEESLIYEFEKPLRVRSTQVYWLDFDHYDGDFRVPESWKLLYKDMDDQWKEVESTSAYTVDKDTWNQVEFEPVTAKALRIQAQLQKGVSGGVIEWKVNEQ